MIHRMADNMKTYGGFLPGIRPGRDIPIHHKVRTRFTFAGSIYLAIVCVIPDFLSKVERAVLFRGLAVVVSGLPHTGNILSPYVMRNTRLLG